jgi:1-acyl-sn-glycerol-3-phosphate acyltransferase
VIEAEQPHPHLERPLWQYWLGRGTARLLGFDFEGPLPVEPKMVILSGPHTSNWDFVHMVCAAFIYRAPMRVMVKDSLFRPPLGALVRAIGAFPIDRSSAHGVVDQMVRLFEEHERLLLVVPASGTRSRRDHWKSGFYWVAHRAKVPIALSYIDYDNKKAGFRGLMWTTGDVKADMDRIRAAYADIRGKHPQNRSEIRLRDEDRSERP